jgi:hypothetical protein
VTTKIIAFTVPNDFPNILAKTKKVRGRACLPAFAACLCAPRSAARAPQRSGQHETGGPPSAEQHAAAGARDPGSQGSAELPAAAIPLLQTPINPAQWQNAPAFFASTNGFNPFDWFNPWNPWAWCKPWDPWCPGGCQGLWVFL